MSCHNGDSNVISNITWLMFDKILILIMNMLVTVEIANYYGAYEYGTYQYAVTIVAIFELLVAFSDGRVFKKHFLTNDEDIVVGTATMSRILFSGLSLLIGICFIFLFNADKKFNTIFIILLINAIVLNFKFGMSTRFEYNLKSKHVVIASDISLILGFFLQFIAVKKQYDIIFIAYITVITSLINVIIQYIQYKHKYSDGNILRFDKNLLKTVLVESAPLALAAACSNIYSRCDTLMVGAMLSKADVGVYAIAGKLIAVTQIGIVPIRESVYPKLIQLYSKDKMKYAEKYVQITSILSWICIIGIFVSFIVLPYCFNFLSQDYELAYPVYQIYVIGTFFLYNAGLRAGHFTLTGNGNILLISQIVCVVLNLILNFFLISLFGIYGAAMATVITQGLSLLFLNLFFKEGRRVFFWQITALNPRWAVGCIKKGE